MNAKIPEEKIATEYLASERTFLAWIRTSIAVIGLGFVVAKFGVWIKQLASEMGAQVHSQGPGVSVPMGVTMMAFGGVLAILAAWHYHVVNVAIERGEVRANRWMVFIVTGTVALMALMMIGYLVLTVERF